MSKTIYIGIIGWGEHTEFLARAFHYEIKDTEILALASQNQAAQKFSRDVLGLKHIFSNPHPLYELHQLDLICIDSSAEYHLDEVSKCLDSGVNVLVSHPLSSNVSDCLAIEKVARSHPNQKVMLALPRRFDPKVKMIKNQLDQGKIGNLISITIENYEALTKSHKDESFAISKGIFMDLTLQDIDIVRWLTGAEFTSVYAQGSAIKYPSLSKNNDVDTAIIAATTDKGILVDFHATRTGIQEDGYCIIIKGTKGEIKYDSRPTSVSIRTEAEDTKCKIVQDRSNYMSILKNYTSHIINNDRLPYDIKEGTYATKVAVAMTKSYVLGEVIKID